MKLLILSCTALDFASHQGYFTIELSEYFKEVLGLELRSESIEQAKLISSGLGVSNVSYKQCDLLDLNLIEISKADFVLVYGLLYHLEDPIKILRVASELSKQHILIETQIFPYDISGKIGDGSYNWQRSVAGIFSLSVDYKERIEGGITDLAFVPSLNALLFLLDHFGFKKVRVIDTTRDDY
jgi:tRNA (mo5U34)-methyltransferase